MDIETAKAIIEKNEFLLADEVAALARCRPEQIRRWAKIGKFPAYRKIGHCRYWHRDEVLEFLRERPTEKTETATCCAD